MKQSLTFRLRCVRFVVLTMLVGLVLAGLPPDGRAGFEYAIKTSQTSPTPPKGVTITDFDFVVDTSTLAAGGLSKQAPNIVGNVPGAGIVRGPFTSLVPQNVTGQPFQQRAHFVGGTAAAATPYNFGFGLRQTANVQVKFTAALWSLSDNSTIAGTAVGFAIPVVGLDQDYTLFNDTGASFYVVGVSTLVNSGPLDLSTIDPGSAPGFDSQPGTFLLSPGGGMQQFTDPGITEPGNWAYIQGFTADPSNPSLITGSFIYGVSAPEVPAPPGLVLAVTGVMCGGVWWVAGLSRKAKRAAAGAAAA
jgi:hypothetical protein